MGALIGRRIGSTILVLLGVALVTFLLLQLVPGDPARTLAGNTATEAEVQAIREDLGLNRPLPLQFMEYVTGIVTGDMGRSLVFNQEVTALILPRLENTMILTLAAMIICVLIGVVIGILAAQKQYGLFDRAAIMSSLAGASLPPYWFGLILIGIFSLQLGWFPTQGMYDARNPGGFPDLMMHLVLPAVTAALVPLAVIARLTRSVVVEALEQDYIKTLRASGVSEKSILWKHALRNSLPPIVTIIALQAGNLLGGIIFVEVVFSWPGLGQQLYLSIAQGDIPMVQAGVLFIALVFVILNLAADTLVGMLDPRTRRKASA